MKMIILYFKLTYFQTQLNEKSVSFPGTFLFIFLLDWLCSRRWLPTFWQVFSFWYGMIHWERFRCSAPILNWWYPLSTWFFTILLFSWEILPPILMPFCSERLIEIFTAVKRAKYPQSTVYVTALWTLHCWRVFNKTLTPY